MSKPAVGKSHFTPLADEFKELLDLHRRILFWQGFLDESFEYDRKFYLQMFNTKTSAFILQHEKKVFFLRRMHVVLLTLLIATHISCQVMGVITYWDDKTALMENTMYILLRILFVVCVINVFKQAHLLNALLTRVEHLGKHLLVCNEDLHKKIKSSFKMSKILTQFLYLALCPLATSLIAGISGFYCYPQRRQWTKNWYPYNAMKSPAFEITLTVFTIENIYLAGTACTFVSSALFTLKLIVVSFMVVVYKAENIREISIVNLLKRKSVLDQVTRMRHESSGHSTNIVRTDEVLIPGRVQDYRHDNVIIIEEVHEDITTNIHCGEETSQDGAGLSNRCPVFVHEDNTRTVGDQDSRDQSVFTLSTRSHRICRRNKRTTLNCPSNRNRIQCRPSGLSVPNKSPQDLEKTMKTILIETVNQQDLDKTMKTILIETVNQHIELLRSVREVNIYIKYICMCIVIANYVLFAATVMLFQIDISTSKKILCALGTGTIIITFLGMCYCGTKITEQAAALGEAVYSSDWLEASPTLKKSMLIVMTIANIPVEMKAQGLDAYSLRLFSEVSKIAYKMTTNLSNFIKMKS